MNKQQFVEVWSNRVGWALEVVDALLASATILVPLILLASLAIESGGSPLLVMIGSVAIGVGLFRYAFGRLAWIFGYTVGIILMVLAGVFLGLLSLVIYGKDSE